MPRLKLVGSEAALADLRRLYEFLAVRNKDAAKRAIQTVRLGVKMLARHPQAGRIFDPSNTYVGEIVVPFGQSAYVVLYRATGEELVLLAVRHGREAAY
jgi:plasmid stabilization system protein ParE